MGLDGSVDVDASVTTSPTRGAVGNQVNEALGGPGGAGTTTVSVAARVSALPATFVKMARTMGPLSPALAAGSARVFRVAAAIGLKLPPPSVDSCHCSDGGGAPLAAALKVGVPPATTVASAGWTVTAGATFTVRRAGAVKTVDSLLPGC